MRMSGRILAASLLFVGWAAQAAVKVKANNTTNLNVGVSWVGNSIPYSTDMAQWDATVTGANSVDLGGNLSFRGLTVANPGGAVTIGGAHTLTLGGEGLIMRTGTGDLTFSNADLTLLMYAGQIWDIVTGSIVTVNPTTFTRAYGSSIGFVNSGTVNSSTLTNDATGIIGPWARTGAGTTTRYATMSGGAVVPYAAGTVAATAAEVTDTTGTANYDLSATGAAMGTGASFNTLRLASSSGTITGSYSANGLMNAGSGQFTLSGAATIGTNNELVVTAPDTTRKIELSGVVSDNPGGDSGITVAGGGQVNLTANNTYSGQTVVGAGRLYINKADALGSTNGNTVIHVIGSSVTGGILQVNGNITVAEPLLFVGPGDGSPWHQALQSSGGTNTLTGPITIATSGGCRLTASGNGTGLNINGPITRTTAGSTLILGANGGTGIVNVNYPINNNGGDVNLHNGGGTIRFNVTSNNIGNINVQYQHVLQLGISDALSVSRSITVGNSRTQTGTAAQGSFDLAGFDQKVDAFNGDGEPVTAPYTTRAVTNSAPGLSTFTTGSNNSGGTFNGMFGSNLAYVKMGSGTQILCGPNFHTGGTTVSGGTLVLSNAVNHGALTVNGGTFRFPPSLTVNGNLSGTGGTIDTGDAASVLTVSQTGNTTFAGALNNAGALVKSGSGTLTFSGSNSYSGGTTVSEGALVFGKVASLPLSGSVTVAAGATLGLGAGTNAVQFSAADVDSLWANTLSGVTMDDASLVGIDTSAGDFTYATSQTDARGLIKTGNNTLTLSGVNTYSGGTVVQQGVLSIPATTALPGWDTAGSYEVWRDAALAVQNAIVDAEVATILSTGNFDDGAHIGFDTAAGNRTYAVNISNTTEGVLGVYKAGLNTLYLHGTNGYDGNTVVAGGILSVNNSSALGSTNGTTQVNRVGGTSPLYTDATGQLQLNSGAETLVLDENFYLTGAEQYGYTGALRNNTGNSVLNGWIKIFGASVRIGVNAGNLTLNGPIERIDAATNPMLVLNPSTGLLIVSNRIDIGTGGLNFHSGGTVWLCATGNVWTGYEQVQYGCTVRLGVDEALPTGVKLTLGNPGTTPGNGRFDLYGFDQTIGGLAQYGDAASYPNNLIRNTQAGDPATLTVSQAAGVSDTFSGRIIENVSLVMAGTPTSTLTLASTNSFSGATVVSGGTLVVSATGTLGDNCTNVVVEAGTLALQNSAVIANTATLTLVSGGGAKVDLAAGVDESVRYLIVDDKMLRAGTYGSTDSTAANKDNDLFSGTGLLRVLNDNSGTVITLK
jgi:autotransporter-associated beta strand protein